MKDDLTPALAEARRRFDEACERLRPELHRFCTRMAGDPCEGEDLVQDTLAHAFYCLPELRDGGALRPWLFRIAHNRCIDLLRGRRRPEPLAEGPDGAGDETMSETVDRRRRAEGALARLVTELPPKERACVVLKDVLDCSLEEAAEITGSNVGAVKAALHRGREKLEAAGRAPARRAPLDARRRALVERYVDAFNRHDWAGVRALLADEARLEVVHRREGPFEGDAYFTNYARLAWPWRLGLAWVDGVESVVHFRDVGGVWVPHAIVELRVEGGRVAVVRDYVHVDYLLRHCEVSGGPAEGPRSAGPPPTS